MIFFKFLSNFWKHRLSKNVWDVFAKRFDRLSRNSLSVVPSIFAKIYPNFVTFDRFFKTKKKISKIRKKSEKIHKHSKKFEKWDCGCIPFSWRPHIDAWRRNCFQSSKSKFRSNTVDIRETKKFWGWPTLPRTILIFFSPTSYKTSKTWFFG